MKLPATTIVIITIVVLVLVVLVMFFLSAAGAKMNQAEADRIFTEQCLDLCKQTQENGLSFLMSLSTKYPQFIDACEVKYGIRVENICISYCGQGCAIKATPQQQLCEKAMFHAGVNDNFRTICEELAKLPEYAGTGASCDKC